MKAIAYPIQAVSRLTGLSIDTIRVWERRYGAVKPARNERGRVYDERDVQRLILLRETVEGGHPIGTVAALSRRDLEGIRTQSAALAALAPETPDARSQSASPGVKALHDAIRRFDCLEFDEELNRLSAAMRPRNLVYEVVIPLMHLIGEEWRLGRLSIAQEHLASGAFRNLLGSLVRLYGRRRPSASFVFATSRNERHEFGILCAAMLAASGGFGIVYLGADLPALEIIEAVQATGAVVLALGVKAAIAGKGTLEELQSIAEKLPPSVELWVGGVRSPGLVREIKATRARYLRDLAALETEMVRLGGRL
jgi:methanogenic corrinoid protein MtbC1